MAESDLLIFWEMFCFISGKSFLFQKIVVLTTKTVSSKSIPCHFEPCNKMSE